MKNKNLLDLSHDELVQKADSLLEEVNDPNIRGFLVRVPGSKFYREPPKSSGQEELPPSDDELKYVVNDLLIRKRVLDYKKAKVKKEEPIIAKLRHIAELVEGKPVADRLDDIRKNREEGRSVADRLDDIRKKREQGNWVPANRGTETPFVSRSGRRLLYVWQQSTGRHAYLDLGTDMILTDEEAENALGLK
jgi:hypothetical protein